jgi:outer membrane lipoprotein carrier protein
MIVALAIALPLALAAPTPGKTSAGAVPPAQGARTARSGQGQGEDAAAVARKVQAYYERTRDLTARFKQTYAYAGFGRRQTSSGNLLVKKPGMMRWDYEKPAKKIVAVKGSRLVQYEPGENQAYVDERFDASAMSAAVTFLLGQGDLLREFEVSLDDVGGLVLRPREPDPRVASITLAAAADGQVSATRVVDESGNVNEIELEVVKRNAGLDDAAFDVALPADVQRIAPPAR